MKKLLLIFMIFIFVSGCQQVPDIANQNKKDEEIQFNSNLPFPTLLPIKESEIRGINVAKNTFLTLDEMEMNLMYYLKNKISTKLFYSPGELLTATDVQNFLKNKTPENNGLNPENSTDKLITTLIEQDYKNNDNIEYVAIGIGIDPTYMPKKENNEIDYDSFLNYNAKIIGNEITNVIKDKLEYDFNIIYYFYQQSTNVVLPGTYFGYGEVSLKKDKKENNLEKVNVINEEYIPFLESTGAQKDNTLNEELKTLKSNVLKNFGDNIGINAIGYYQENNLNSLEINIILPTTTNIEGNIIVDYIESEINSLKKYNLKIKVNSAMGIPIGIIEINNKNINKIMY